MSSYRFKPAKVPVAQHAAAAAAADADLDPLAEPDRVTVAGDWHGDHGAAKWAIRDAASAGSSVLLHTGDFGIYGDRDGELFLDRISGWLGRYGMVLLTVDGNHEDFSHLESYPCSARHGLRPLRPRVYHLPRGTRWTWAGLTWLALGGAASLDRSTRTAGVDWWPQEDLTYADVDAASAPGRADVMLTHDMPNGVGRGDAPSGWPAVDLLRAMSNRALLTEVVRAVRPTHLFHGHMHYRHTTDLDLGAGLACQVTGLDRNTTQGKSQVHVDLAALAADSAARRQYVPFS